MENEKNYCQSCWRNLRWSIQIDSKGKGWIVEKGKRTQEIISGIL